MKKYIWLLLLVSFNISLAQNISVNGYTDKQKYLIGDYIIYTLEIIYPSKFQISFPKIQDSVKQLEYIKSEKLINEKIENRIRSSKKFIFSKYQADTVVIPEIKIELREKNTNKIIYASTSQIEIMITAFDVKDSKDIVDIKQPVKVPFDWWIVIYILLGLCLITIVGYFIWKKYIKKKLNMAEENIVYIPPYKIALNRLAELENKRLWQQGKIKEFHSEITEIIRRYFEDEFLFKALEMTSDEICHELENNVRAKSIQNIVDKFFSNADMVKFAKFKPQPSINEEMLAQAYEIVNQTKGEFQENEKSNV